MKPDEMLSRVINIVIVVVDSREASLLYHKLYCQITQNSHISDLEYYIHIHINVIRNKYINTQMTEL